MPAERIKELQASAKAYLAENNLPGLLVVMEEWAHHEPHDPRVLFNLGLVNLDLGRAPKAKEILERARDLSPQDPKILEAYELAVKAVNGEPPPASERPFDASTLEQQLVDLPSPPRIGMLLSEPPPVVLPAVATLARYNTKPGDAGYILQTADSKQYGPVAFHDIERWMAEGRVPADAFVIDLTEGIAFKLPQLSEPLSAEAVQPRITQAPAESAESPNTRGGRPRWVNLLIVLAALVIVASVTSWLGYRSLQQQATMTCLNNQRQLAIILSMYAQDHAQLFPDANHWWLALHTYRVDADIRCPNAPYAQQGYGFNRFLSQYPLDDVDQPERTLLLADSNAEDMCIATLEHLDANRHHVDADRHLLSGNGCYMVNVRGEVNRITDGMIPTQHGMQEIIFKPSPPTHTPPSPVTPPGAAPTPTAPTVLPGTPSTPATTGPVLKDYVGMRMQDVVNDLHALGLRPSIRFVATAQKPPNAVISTDPAAGAQVSAGSPVVITAAK